MCRAVVFICWPAAFAESFSPKLASNDNWYALRASCAKTLSNWHSILGVGHRLLSWFVVAILLTFIGWLIVPNKATERCYKSKRDK